MRRFIRAKSPLPFAISTLTTAMLATAAWAQEPVTTESQELDVVTVAATASSDGTTEGTGSYTSRSAKTATPLNLSLRDTPQSVSVVTQQRIEDQQLKTVMDVVNNATGVSVNRYETNRAQFNARGFEINSLMVDGVSTIWDQPWSSGEVFSSLSPYDRVEIVRGANGLMTGAGDPSASINLVHKRAHSKETTGSVEFGVGSWSRFTTQVDASSALNTSGSVRGRVVGEFVDGDSWVNLLANKQESLFGTMDIDLGENTVLWFGASHQANATDSPAWGGLPVWYSDGSRTNWDRSKTASATWARWDSTYDNYFANIEHSFANSWKAKLSYSHGERNADSYLLYLFGGSPDKTPANDMMTWPGAYQTKTTQDDISLDVSGAFDFLSRSHELAFGYTFSNQNFDAKSRAPLTGLYSPIDFDNYNGGFAEPVWGPLSYYDNTETTQEAFYAMTRLSLADPLKLILGARLSDYEKTGTNSAELTKVTNELTPYAGLIYDISSTLSAYASYTDIFLPQSERDINKNYLDPIVGKSMETGIKGEFMEGRLNTSASVFRIEQDGLAKSTGLTIPGTMGELAYTTSEGATSKGFELEVSGELSADWRATLGYTQFTASDAAGDDVNTLYPRKLLRLFSTYQLPGALDKLTVGGGVNWQETIYTLATNPAGNPERINQKAYALLNLMARYDISPQLAAQLNVSNATDETYFDVFDAYGALTYGEPRNITASVKYKF
ncbi:MAG: TonB-dependent siderophore receptor [Pedobacter sp.]|nr:TonB-dependent siderophore receptor [Pedobacter sp.]